MTLEHMGSCISDCILSLEGSVSLPQGLVSNRKKCMSLTSGDAVEVAEKIATWGKTMN